MKIICIGKNYADHAKEMGGTAPEKPVFFLKPDTAILGKDQDFYLPDFTQNLHYEIELVVKIVKNGKHINQQFASNYYNEITVGIDFTARDLQDEAKKKGLPWEIAKAFDNSAVIGSRFIPLNSLKNSSEIAFTLCINNQKVQSGLSTQMIFSIDTVIAYVSQFITLKTGDLLFTGTPAGVGAVKQGDHLTGFLEEEKLLDFFIK